MATIQTNRPICSMIKWYNCTADHHYSRKVSSSSAGWCDIHQVIFRGKNMVFIYPWLNFVKLSSPILDHMNFGEDPKISKKFLIVIHQKLNGGCTTHVENLIFTGQCPVLDVPRLLQAYCLAILSCLRTLYSTSSRKKYDAWQFWKNARQIWKIHAATQGAKNYGSGTRPLTIANLLIRTKWYEF